MDALTIAKLLGVPPPELKAQVEQAIIEAIDKIERYGNFRLDMPTVKYDLRGKTAGYAWYHTNTIELNLDLLLNPATRDEMLQVTVPHEVAHLAARKIWPRLTKHHGPEWQMLMVGLPPDRCHTLPTVAARKTQKFNYTCGCINYTHKLGLNRYRKVQGGLMKFTCRNCGRRLQFKDD